MSVKSPKEIEQMKEACQIAARTLTHVEKFIKAGISTNEINQIAHDFILSHGAIPAPLNYHGFPKSICTSINHVICHGVPDDQILQEGDVINVDVTAIKNGFHGDTSRSFFVGQVSDKAKAITQAAYEAMMKGIELLKEGTTTGDIGFAIEKFTTRKGYYVVRELGGHGIGRKFHEEPFVPSFGKKGKGFKLREGMTITVEPMINETSAEVLELDIPNSDIKVYETSDKTLSAQFEHTVLVTKTGYEILTVD